MSVDRDDHSFSAFEAAKAAGKNVRAYLDGVEVEHCRMADDELGVVERIVPDEAGRPQTDPDNPNEIWTEIVRGEVEIIIEDEAPANA